MQSLISYLGLVLRPQLATLLAVALLFCSVIVGVSSPGNHAAAAANSTINFQARLMTGTGGLAADGDYNIEFKIYDTASTGGTAQGVCTGNCKWAETRTGADKVHVANGYVTVTLGSVTSFASTINWDQELWITMNVGGTGSPAWDGEMTPRLKLTAVPFAHRAGALAGGTGANTTVLDTGTPSGINLLHLPAESGTLCVQGASTCGFAPGTSGSYIQNQNSIGQTANFRITGAGRADTALQAPAFDATSDTTTLTVGATNATSITIGNTANNTPILLQSGTGTITARGNNASAFQVQNASSVALFSVNTTGTDTGIHIAGIGAGGGGGRLYFGPAGDVDTFIGETGTTDTDSLVLQGDYFTFQHDNDFVPLEIDAVNGHTVVKSFDGTFGGFTVRRADNNQSFSVSGDSTKVTIGNNFDDTLGTLLVLDTKEDAGDPTAITPINGSMYYNGAASKFRCYEGNAWKDCIDATAGSAFLQGGNSFGATGVLGTNDTNNLQFKTNNTVRATFDQSNGLYLGNGVMHATPNNFTIAGTGSSAAGTAGADLTLQGGAGASATTGSAGGSLKLQGGNAGGSGNNNGGTAYIYGGTKTSSGTDGNVVLAHNGTSALGNVGIGLAAPTRTLDITVSNSTVNGLPVRISQTGAGDTGIELSEPGQSFYLGVDVSDHKLKISSNLVGSTSTNMGYVTIGASTDSTDSNVMNATKFTAGATGTINTVYAYVASPIGGSPNNKAQAAIYSDNSGTPGTRLTASAGDTTLTGDSWNAIPVPGLAVTNGTVYWILYNTNGTAAAHNNLKFDSNGTANQTRWSNQTYGTWPGSWPGTTGSNNTQFSMYAPVMSGSSADHLSGSLFQMSATGQTLFQNSVNSTTGFQVQNAAGTNTVLSADTSNGRVGINLAAGSAPTADLSFGVGARIINILTQTATNTAGSNLTVNSGAGNGNGAGGILTVQSGQGGATGVGGEVKLQGGSGGSTSGAGGLATVQGGNATAGNSAGGGVSILGGTATGSGAASVIAITAGAGVVGQNVAGGNVNITSGAGGGNQVGGTIALQAGSGGATGVGGQITVIGGSGGGTALGGAITIRGGTGSTSGAGGILTLQGGTGGNTATGGVLAIQGGNAGGGTANGANVTITGGTGAGTGVRGLVVIDTPTFTTTTTDANCGATTAVNCTIASATVNNTSSVVVGATAAGVTITMPDPTIVTAGRLFYFTASSASTSDFTLALNAGGTLINIAMRANSTATLIWNGADWTAAGASSSTTLQSAYDSTLTSAGGAEIVLNNSVSSNGLTIRNNASNPVIGGILEVQTSIGTNLFSVNNNISELVANGGAEDSSTFATNWTTLGGSTIARNTTANQFATGTAGVSVAAGTTAGNGVRQNLASNPATNTSYLISFTAQLASGSPAFTDLRVDYTPTGAATGTQCIAGQTIVTGGWTKITCEFVTPATTVTNADILIYQAGAAGSARTFYIDNLSMTLADNSGGIPNNVQIGGGIYGGPPTLFTLDRSSAPPVANGNTTYLGSMYYDTTSGRIQCYESDGWGACGSAPNNIISLTPEYSGAVLNGTGIGTLSADFCANSAALTVGSLCASGISRNFYKWTSPQATEQVYSIYVSYKLPTTFKAFDSANTMSLTWLTDSANGTNGKVTYQVYRSTGGAITSCDGTTESTVATPTANTWYTTAFNGDETACGFAGGDNIIFKINVKARSNANVYVENLNFTYTNT